MLATDSSIVTQTEPRNLYLSNFPQQRRRRTQMHAGGTLPPPSPPLLSHSCGPLRANRVLVLYILHWTPPLHWLPS